MKIWESPFYGLYSLEVKLVPASGSLLPTKEAESTAPQLWPRRADCAGNPGCAQGLRDEMEMSWLRRWASHDGWGEVEGSTRTYHAPFCVKPFGPAGLEVAGVLAGGFLQKGTFIGVQHFKGVCVLPNTDHLPLLGPAPTLDGTLEKEAEKDKCHMIERGWEIPSIEEGFPELSIIASGRFQFSWQLCFWHGKRLP